MSLLTLRLRMDSILRNLFPNLPQSPLNQGISNLISQNKEFASLLQHKRLPNVGWDDYTIQSFLFVLRQLDTNSTRPVVSLQHQDHNQSPHHRWCGVGEREGRVYSNLVATRHYGFSHGIGRSGDLTEVQPKAIGSSILVQLTTRLVLDAMHRGAGLSLESTRFGLLLPMCTGMSISLILSSLASDRSNSSSSSSSSSSSNSSTKNIVLWSRIDQKSCLKAISAAGLVCVVVPTKLQDDQVVCDVDALENLIQHHDSKIVAIITTTSCFAPRIPDPIEYISKLCLKANIPHIINNAYGLQCKYISKAIHRATLLGRVDAIISSMDKNFLVPVGGAIVTSSKKHVVDDIAKSFAGRASSSAVMDLFITLCSMGLSGYKRLLDERQNLIPQFTSKLHQVANKFGGRLLVCPNNTISFAITLDHLISCSESEYMSNNESKYSKHHSQGFSKELSKSISYFGSMLFTRCVSGTRVVPICETKEIGGYHFLGYGSSTDNYPYSYMTAACSIGLSRSEMDEFFVRLDKCFEDYFRRTPVQRNI